MNCECVEYVRNLRKNVTESLAIKFYYILSCIAPPAFVRIAVFISRRQYSA